MPFLANRREARRAPEERRGPAGGGCRTTSPRSRSSLRGLKQQHGEIERELTSLRARCGRSTSQRAYWRFVPPFVSGRWTAGRVSALRRRALASAVRRPRLGRAPSSASCTASALSIARARCGLCPRGPVGGSHASGERLVYFRVLSHRAADVQTSPAAVLRKLVLLKPDSPFYDWLESEIARRFDLVLLRHPGHNSDARSRP